MKKSSRVIMLFFLVLFSLSVGLFSNYAEMWLAENGLQASSISSVFSVSYVVTVLLFLYFTIRFSKEKLRKGILLSIGAIVGCNVILIFLNGKSSPFLIKFFMFFNLAFTELVASSIYPLMISFDKSDEAFTKNDFISSLCDSFGFLLASLLLGKVIFGKVFDYNTCLIISTIVAFFSIFALMFVRLPKEDGKESFFDLKETMGYFSHNKVLYLYLLINVIGSIVWCSILGMPLLSVTEKFGFSANTASILVLGLGIISNFLAVFVLKYLRFKNDHINLFFKFGVRVILFILSAASNNIYILAITFVYMALTDCTYEFIFNSFFLNNIEEKHIVFFTALKYSANLIGCSIGTAICGFVFDYDIRLNTLPAVVLGIVHYIFCSILVEKKASFKKASRTVQDKNS